MESWLVENWLNGRTARDGEEQKLSRHALEAGLWMLVLSVDLDSATRVMAGRPKPFAWQCRWVH